MWSFPQPAIAWWAAHATCSASRSRELRRERRDSIGRLFAGQSDTRGHAGCGIRRRQDSVDAEDVNDADRADADHVGEAGSCAWVLAWAAFAAELGGDLADLSDAGGADGVAHREQAAGGADGDASADVELTFGELRCGLADRRESERFDVKELLDGERVVELDDVEVGCGDAGVGERDLGSFAGERCVEVLAAVDGLGPGG